MTVSNGTATNATANFEQLPNFVDGSQLRFDGRAFEPFEQAVVSVNRFIHLPAEVQLRQHNLCRQQEELPTIASNEYKCFRHGYVSGDLSAVNIKEPTEDHWHFVQQVLQWAKDGDLREPPSSIKHGSNHSTSTVENSNLVL